MSYKKLEKISDIREIMKKKYYAFGKEGKVLRFTFLKPLLTGDSTPLYYEI